MTQTDRAFYNKFFVHFALRLIERYGIYLTFDNYVILCKQTTLKKQSLVKSKKGGIDCYAGQIEIDGQIVNVLKSSFGLRPLLTALPKHSKI